MPNVCGYIKNLTHFKLCFQLRHIFCKPLPCLDLVHNSVMGGSKGRILKPTVSHDLRYFVLSKSTKNRINIVC